MYFKKHVTPQYLVRWEQFLDMSDIIITFVVTQKVPTHILECNSFFFSIWVFNKRRI